MKGPFERLKYDLRRMWECPTCKRRERTAGTATFRHCSCQMQKLDGKPVVMTLIADGVQRLVPEVAPPHSPEVTIVESEGNEDVVSTEVVNPADPETGTEH